MGRSREGRGGEGRGGEKTGGKRREGPRREEPRPGCGAAWEVGVRPPPRGLLSSTRPLLSRPPKHPTRAGPEAESVSGCLSPRQAGPRAAAASTSCSPRVPAPPGSPSRALAHRPGLLGHTHARPGDPSAPPSPEGAGPRSREEGKARRENERADVEGKGRGRGTPPGPLCERAALCPRVTETPRSPRPRPQTSSRPWGRPLGPGQPIPEEVGGGGGVSGTCRAAPRSPALRDCKAEPLGSRYHPLQPATNICAMGQEEKWRPICHMPKYLKVINSAAKVCSILTLPIILVKLWRSYDQMSAKHQK
nr:translation initiation factor IF-2-like [Pan troglodytes]